MWCVSALRACSLRSKVWTSAGVHTGRVYCIELGERVDGAVTALCVLRRTTYIVYWITAPYAVLSCFAVGSASDAAILPNTSSRGVRFRWTWVYSTRLTIVVSSMPRTNFRARLAVGIFGADAGPTLCFAWAFGAFAQAFIGQGTGWPRDERLRVYGKALFGCDCQRVSSLWARLTGRARR